MVKLKRHDRRRPPVRRAASYRQPPLPEEQLQKARARAQHVIVLMLENRSFDHMLGFLEHPNPEFAGFSGMSADELPTVPVDLNDPRSGTVQPTPNAEPRLGVDPPHGHVSALLQMHQWGTAFRMDGFPTAYGHKLAGKEDVPVVKWGRIALISPLLALMVAAAIYNAARMGVGGGWVHFIPWLAGGLVSMGAVTVVLNLRHVPGLTASNNLLLVTVASVVVALSAHGVWRWLTGDRGWFGWPVIVWALLLAVIWIARRKYVQRARVPGGRLREESKRIMACMPPSQVPVLTKLACEFAVCTCWHSSVPGATWPNRNFAHAGTSDESVDIELGLYEDRTIFDLLDCEYDPIDGPALSPTWRIYYDKTPQVIAFSKLWRGWRSKNWLPVPQLIEDIASYRADNVTLPMYSFVEPRHMGEGTNSQHPGNNEYYGSEDFERGEALIAAIYNALVAKPDLFKKTVFLITYDEHGGLYDHVAPPAAVPPDPLRQRNRNLGRNLVSWFIAHKKRTFPFDHLGVRVPTVVVSPWIRPGTVCTRVYDHASIPATVHRLFAPNQPTLSAREEQANDILHLLTQSDHAIEPTATEPNAVRSTPFLDTSEPSRAGPAVIATGRDPFATQLATVEDLMRVRLAPVVLRQQVGVTADAAQVVDRTPPMELFAAAADSTRNGNPLPEDF